MRILKRKPLRTRRQDSNALVKEERTRTIVKLEASTAWRFVK